MTAAQLTARQQNADRRARDLTPVVRFLAADRWAVESATKTGVAYLISADADGVHCPCTAGSLGLPCFHAAAVLIAARTPEPPTPAAPAVAREAIGRYVVVVAIPGKRPSRVVRFGAAAAVAAWAEMLARRAAWDYGVARAAIGVTVTEDPIVSGGVTVAARAATGMVVVAA